MPPAFIPVDYLFSVLILRSLKLQEMLQRKVKRKLKRAVKKTPRNWKQTSTRVILFSQLIKRPFWLLKSS